MQVIQAPNKQSEWDNFVSKNNGLFPQSFAWGEILISENKRVERLQIIDDDNALVSQALVVYQSLPFGKKYAFCPRGPVFVSGTDQSQKILSALKKYFVEKKCVFFRLEPNEKIQNLNKKISDINPSTTLILNLQQTEAELLSGMEKKTRYEIRRAENSGVEVIEKKDLEIFWHLLGETASRDNFSPHPKAHYEQILKNNFSHQLIAYHDGAPIASAIFFEWDKTLTYLFAATLRGSGHFSASYLIQLEAFRLGQRLGMEEYDFFGIAPNLSSDKAIGYDYDRHHRYAGFTRFKIGFGGQAVSLPGTFDMVLQPFFYSLYCGWRFLRQLF